MKYYFDRNREFWEKNKDLNQTNIAILDSKLKLVLMLENLLIQTRIWERHKVFLTDVMQIIDKNIEDLKLPKKSLWRSNAEDFLERILWPEDFLESSFLKGAVKTEEQIKIEDEQIVYSLIVLSEPLSKDLATYALFIRQIQVLESLYELNFDPDLDIEKLKAERMGGENINPSISE